MNMLPYIAWGLACHVPILAAMVGAGCLFLLRRGLPRSLRVIGLALILLAGVHVCLVAASWGTAWWSYQNYLGSSWFGQIRQVLSIVMAIARVAAFGLLAAAVVLGRDSHREDSSWD